MKRILSIILMIICSCTLVRAQKGLAVQEVFDEMAVNKNATEVVMSSGKLKAYHLSFYHSIEVRTPSAAERQRMEHSVQADAMSAIISEETPGHRFYEMPQQRGIHRYILYRSTDSNLTLIYLEGKASLKQIKGFFQKKQ